MIKRKIRKHKRNPKIDEIPLTPKEIIYLKSELTHALSGSWTALARALKILKIGFTCTDCENSYSSCQCEFCDDCKLPECMCNFDVWFDGNASDLLSMQKTQKLTWSIIKELFDIKNLNNIKNDALKIVRDNEWLKNNIIEITK